MRVILSGYYGFQNGGDEAILQAIIQALRQKKTDIRITVLSHDPDYTKKTYGVDAVNRWKIAEVWKAMKAADAVISGGGSLLQDKTSWKSVPYYIGVMQMAYFLRKPVFVYAQGIGPLERAMSRMLVKYALSKADYLSVRDQDSVHLLREIGIKKTVETVPDPVLGIKCKQGLNRDWIKQQGLTNEKFICVAVRDWHSASFDLFKKKIVDVFNRCSNEGYPIVFLPMHGEYDDVFSREMASAIEHHDRVFIFPYDRSIEEKISIIHDSTLLLGMRLHALIFAAIAHTPMIAISYDPKIDAFMKQVDQPLIGHVDDNWSSQQLYELIKKQLMERDEQANKLKIQVESIQQKANETANKIIEMLA